MSKDGLQESVRNRIALAVSAAGGVESLAVIAGVSPRTVYAWRSGERSPTIATYSLISAWLEKNNYLSRMAILAGEQGDCVREDAAVYSSGGGSSALTDEYVGVSFYENKETHSPILFSRNNPAHGARAPGQLRFLRMKGRSMEPTLRHNDLCVLDMSESSLEEDGIYLVRYEKEVYIRRYCPVPGTCRFMGDNRDLSYGDFDLEPQEKELSWWVVGRVLWLGRAV